MREIASPFNKKKDDSSFLRNSRTVELCNPIKRVQSAFNHAKFIGTEKYYRITRTHLLTDGTKYLAEKAQCFWLMEAISSHLPKYFHDTFCVANLTMNKSSAVLKIDDGNGNVYASQQIEYTDFPLNEIKFYCCFDGEYWAIMLTSEY